MSALTPDEADQLADLLNHICGVTLDALTSEEPLDRLQVAASLREFRVQLDEQSEVGHFVETLAAWLGGARPDEATTRRHPQPFRRALRTMLETVPEAAAPPATEQPPISGRVLAQLIATVVAAEHAGDVAVQRELAARLVNIHNQLDVAWRPRIGPLLENLRSVLGGAAPHTLPRVPDPFYQNLWQNTANILTMGDLSEATARGQLLDRLVHNTLFTLRSGTPELTAGFLRALLDVQRQAVESSAPTMATLVAAIRAHLQGQDATPFTLALSGEELTAWQSILAGDG